jgi:hypothetical protein
MRERLEMTIVGRGGDYSSHRTALLLSKGSGGSVQTSG